MKRKQMLLLQMAEECNEVAQRISKALRFGLDEKQPDHLTDNADRIVQEFNDLMAVVDMLQDEGVLKIPADTQSFQIQAKKIKIEKYLDYSKQCGILED